MSKIQIQLLKRACYEHHDYRVKDLLSQTDYTEYLGSSDGYKLLCSMLEKSIFSSQHNKKLGVSRELYEYYISAYLEISKSLLQHGAKVNDNNDGQTDTPLHLALKIENEEIFEILLSKGANVNAAGNQRNTPLHLAVQIRNEEIVEILLSKEANVNALDNDGDTPLHIAVRLNSENISRLLLENGADVEICNLSRETPYDICNESLKSFLFSHKIKQFLDNGGKVMADQSLLHEAVKNGRKKVVELLLRRGFNVNVPTECGETPLHLAVKYGCKQIVLSLIQNGANINATTHTTGDSPLHYALLHLANNCYSSDILKILIENGANVRNQNNFGSTPLNHAVKNGWFENVKILLGDNPDPNDKNFKTAFCLSFLEFRFKPNFFFKERIGLISKLFLDLGFTISTEDFDNIPKKLYSVELIDGLIENKFINAVEKLLNKYTSFDFEKRQRACLEYCVLVGAVKCGFVDIFYNLLTPSVNVNATLADGYTLLHHASKNRHLTIVNQLVTRGADINARESNSKMAPLHLAAVKNSVDVCKILLKKGANIDAGNCSNKTPLFLAAEHGSVDCILLLLEAGANVNSVSALRECPLCRAVYKQNAHIAKILLHYGAYVNATDSFRINSIFDDLRYNNFNYTEVVDLLFDYGAKVIDLHPDLFTKNKIFIQLQVKAVATNLEDFHISVDNPEIAYFQTKCLEEIERMKRMKIDECDITLHDLLIMPHRRVAIYMRNEKIVEFLDSIDFETTFPIFASKLRVCVRRGKLEKRLLELSEDCINTIIKIQLPSVVIGEILSYLDTADMHRFIIASPIDLEKKKSVQYKQ